MSNEQQEMKEAEASWHTPTLGIDCPYCEEWNDYQDQNENDGGDRWYFPPCERRSRNQTNVDTKNPIVFTCKNADCAKEFKVAEVQW